MPLGNDMAQSLQTREYRPGDERCFLGLLNESLREGGKAYGEEFWRWKHVDNPFGVSYGRYSWDEAQGRAAALRVLLRWRFKLPDGSEIQAVRAVDTATHADYRRGGLFRKLTETAVTDLTAEGCGFIFNTPNAKSLPGYLKMGWGVVAKWPVYVRVLRPLACLGAAFGNAGSTHSGDEVWDAFFGAGVMPWPEFVSAWGGEIPGVVLAWERDRPKIGLRTPRDGSFLAWRYGRHPAVRYGFVPVEQDGHLAGFAILRPNRRFGLREVVLAEVFLRPGEPHAGKRLMSRVVKEARGDYCVAACSPGTREQRLLRGALFFRVPGRGITLTVRSLNRMHIDPAAPGNWDLTLGDLEVF
jgi:GNAT superfamily N-acetyltransferase